MRTLFKLEKKIFSIQKRKFVTIKSGKEEAPGTVRKNHSIQFIGARLGELDSEMHLSSQMRIGQKKPKNELCNQAICLITSVKDKMCTKIPHNS